MSDRLKANNQVEDFKNSKILADLVKNSLIGEYQEMVCHLVDYDSILCKSTVVDLNAMPGRNIRQIDHRSIDYIIFKGVKYTFGKRPDSHARLDLPIIKDKNKPTWDVSKLKVGDWFSSVNYYTV